MDEKRWEFLKTTPEGAVFVALDSREKGLLSGAVQLRYGEKNWLDYEVELTTEEDEIILYDRDKDILAYNVRGCRVELQALPELLTVFWNRGRRLLFLDGKPLPPDSILGYVPEGVTPWLLRYASWLPL